MEDILNAVSIFGGADSTVFLWIAVGVGALFLAVIVFDAWRRKRRRKRRLSRGRYGADPEDIGLFKRMRRFYSSLRQEAARRQRHSERSRERDL